MPPAALLSDGGEWMSSGHNAEGVSDLQSLTEAGADCGSSLYAG